MIDHVASQCAENPVRYNFASSRWAESEAAGIDAHKLPLEDNRVLMIQPA